MRTKIEKEAFWTLPKSEQRVAIANDVMAQIALGFFRPVSGSYLTVDRVMDSYGYADENLEKQQSCEVCALGACFASAALLGNRFKIGEPIVYKDGTSDSTSFRTVGVGGGHIKTSLKDIFELSQISMIESAFERAGYEYGDVDDNDLNVAVMFGRQYDKSYQRMIAIMQNIVDNNGEFKP